MSGFVLLVLVGVTLTLVVGVVVAVLLALGARPSVEDVIAVESLDGSDESDPGPSDSGRSGTKEIQ